MLGGTGGQITEMGCPWIGWYTGFDIPVDVRYTKPLCFTASSAEPMKRESLQST